MPPPRNPRTKNPSHRTLRPTQSILTLATSTKPLRRPLLRTLFSAASLRRLDLTLKPKPRALRNFERLPQDAEAITDLYDLMERWLRGDDAVFGFPSEAWKA